MRIQKAHEQKQFRNGNASNSHLKDIIPHSRSATSNMRRGFSFFHALIVEKRSFCEYVNDASCDKSSLQYSLSDHLAASERHTKTLCSRDPPFDHNAPLHGAIMRFCYTERCTISLKDVSVRSQLLYRANGFVIRSLYTFFCSNYHLISIYQRKDR